MFDNKFYLYVKYLLIYDKNGSDQTHSYDKPVFQQKLL